MRNKIILNNVNHTSIQIFKALMCCGNCIKRSDCYKAQIKQACEEWRYDGMQFDSDNMIGRSKA